MSFYPPPQPQKRRGKKKGQVVQGLFAALFAIASIATDAFGALPTSPISERFREVLGEAFPLALVEPINDYLQKISVPMLIIPSEMVGTEEIPELLDETELAVLLAEEMVAAILSEEEVATVKEASTGGIDSKDTPTLDDLPTPTEEPPAVITPPVVILAPPQTPPSGPTNTAPTCSTFSVSNSQTTSVLSVDLGALCSDADGNTWTLTHVTQGVNGRTSIIGKSINYDPDTGFAGTDTITFTIADTNNATYTQSFDIIINNAPPVANNDSGSVNQNSINNTLSPLTNDTDAGGDTLTITNIDVSRITGTAAIAPDGQSIIYTPTSGSPPAFGHTGFDYISYTVEDVYGGSSIGEIEILVGVPGWCGEAVGDAALGCLTSNIQLNGITQTSLVVGAGNTFNFQFTYTVWTNCPGCIEQIIPGFNGNAASSCALDAGGLPTSYGAALTQSSPLYTFTAPTTLGTYNIYAPIDWQFNCANAQANYSDRGEVLATINVVANTAPACAGFNYSSPQTTGTLAIDISSVCSDADGDIWAITNVTQGTNGATTFAGKTINYDPNDGFAGTDNLTVTMRDSKGGVSAHAFDVIINNTAPTAIADTASVTENSGTNVINVLANDSDPGNDTFSITSVSQGFNGTVTIQAGNTSLTYEPEILFHGSDSFTYTITDAHGETATGTVNVITNALPVACGGPGSGDTSNIGCELNNLLADGSLPPIYVQPSDTILLDFNYQVWDSLCPTCSYQLLPGLGSNFGGSCQSISSIGAYTGITGASSLNVQAPASPGTYDLYANLAPGCNAVDYLGLGTPFGQVTVCGTVLAQVANGNCYTGPSTSYPTDGWLANTTMWNELTALNNDNGPTWYELTSPSWSCWIPETTILNTQGDATNCVPYKSAPPLPKIILYNAGTWGGGNINSRSNANSICALGKPTGYTNSVSFISFGSGDAISGLAANYSIPTSIEIASTTGTTIANNWSDLLDSTIQNSLRSAFVVAAAEDSWWSGTTSGNGSTTPSSSTTNCSDWNDWLLGTYGIGGNTLATDNTWLNDGTSHTCNEGHALLCLAWD